MMAKEYLSQVLYIDQRINCKLEQVMRLRENATKATATLSDIACMESLQVRMYFMVITSYRIQEHGSSGFPATRPAELPECVSAGPLPAIVRRVSLRPPRPARGTPA